MYRKLGIIGGMGPIATYYLYRLIIENRGALKDQDHIDMMILNDTKIPDRTAAILHGGESPLPYILADCKACTDNGCDVIAIPCNTSHFYIDEIQKECKALTLNMIELTALQLKKRNISEAFVLATEGTLKTGVYAKCLNAHGIKTIEPSEEETGVMMRCIYGIKAGADISDDFARLKKIARSRAESGSRDIILGCTELSTLYDGFFDVGEITITDALRVLCGEILRLFGEKNF